MSTTTRTDESLARSSSPSQDLRTSAPATLLPATLAAIGLADLYAPLSSAIGDVWVAWSGRGVSAVTTAEDAADVRGRLRARLRPAGPPGRSAAAAPGQGRRPSTRRRPPGQDRCRPARPHRLRAGGLLKALQIPRGEVRPYGWIASEIGHPAAVRAVGTALGHNPVPLLIPCHRVVRSDGHIGQYSLGGPGEQARAAQWEGADPDELERLAKAGIRYFGSDTTQIVCHPTCHHARRVTDRHLETFRVDARGGAVGLPAVQDLPSGGSRRLRSAAPARLLAAARKPVVTAALWPAILATWTTRL